MYLYSNINIKSITDNFLTMGYNQNEGDAMHAIIEKQKKKILKTVPIFVPAQWPVIIRSTKDFYNFKDLGSKIGGNFTKNSR